MNLVFSPDGASPRVLSRRRFIWALSATATLALSHAIARADDDDEELEHENLKRLEERTKQQHSDPSGRVRPDLLRQGMEHAQQMPVAHAPGAPAAPPVPAPASPQPVLPR